LLTGWIGTSVSLFEQVDYIVTNEYSGWAVWNVDLDDFSGDLGCGRGPYPLLSTANNRLLETTPTT